MNETSANYWNKRYINDQTGWDIGYSSTPITAFMQNYYHKEAAILIPGAGNAYEAQWLFENGFKNVHVIDIAESPLKSLKSRCPNFPDSNLHLADFFLHKGQYDLILEQTFFCAIHPLQRDNYVIKSKSLLKNGGQMMGLLFNRNFLQEDGPPYGGNINEYKTRFEKHFKIITMQRCYNSIKPRMDSEIFFRLTTS